MNALINYIVEANFGLVLFAAVYWLILRNETEFSVKRIYLVGGILFSILIPLLHINTAEAQRIIPSVGTTIVSDWLPEIVVVGQVPSVPEHSGTAGLSLLSMVGIMYVLITAMCMIIFLTRLTRLLRLLYSSKTYRWHGCRVTESDGERPTFSFFRHIHIGRASRLSTEEKEQILRHEEIHVRKLHSIDLLLISVAGVFFWFNPALVASKRWLTELHEYEADARSLESGDRDSYLKLLTKMLLPTAEFRLANHFNNSMTSKRLHMMNSAKSRIKTWKLLPVVTAVALFFVAAACQEQVMSDLKTVTKNSSTTGVLPEEVSKQLAALQRENPDKEYIVVQMNQEGEATLKKLNVENAETGTRYSRLAIIKPDASAKDPFTYVIVEKNPAIGDLSRQDKGSETIYTIVEEAPSYAGGFDSLVAYLSHELHYPEQARANREEGKVFVSFTVADDGSIRDVLVIKGASELLNHEAIRVVQSMPRWVPGRQDGKAVNVKYTLPINFSLGSATSRPQPEMEERIFQNSIEKQIRNGKHHFEGTIKDDAGQPLQGVHVLLKNTTSGATTGPDGHFTLDTELSSGELVVSYIGYKTFSYPF